MLLKRMGEMEEIRCQKTFHFSILGRTFLKHAQCRLCGGKPDPQPQHNRIG